MATVTVYGASDDLVEVDGDLSEEFYADGESDSTMLAFGDGTVLDVRYDQGGIWRVNRLVEGTATFTKEEALGDEGKREDGKPGYSEIGTLTGDLRWLVTGEKPKLDKIKTEAAVV